MQVTGSQILGKNAPNFLVLFSNRGVAKAAKKHNLVCTAQPHFQAILKNQILGIFNDFILTRCAEPLVPLQLYKLQM
ncbi:hypothetical protein H6H02_02770 [Coleofasciculus sp. FACHB-1120]|nr:hypothetical protein [Coleofasciculus sp. FACHB-1120]